MSLRFIAQLFPSLQTLSLKVYGKTKTFSDQLTRFGLGTRELTGLTSLKTLHLLRMGEGDRRESWEMEVTLQAIRKIMPNIERLLLQGYSYEPVRLSVSTFPPGLLPMRN